jgi:hypothetical protein
MNVHMDVQQRCHPRRTAVKTVRFSLLLCAFAVLSFVQEANAGGYPSLGSAWTYNTYTHSMTFAADAGDLSSPGTEVFFISATRWYDNLAVCKNNSGKVTLVPGVGQSDPGQATSPLPIEVLVDNAHCAGTGATRSCTESVEYVSLINDVPLSPDDLPQVCKDNSFNTQYTCFQFLLGFPTGQISENLECQNKKGRLVELKTKGVCAIVSARTEFNGQPTLENPGEGYRFFWESFFPQPDQTFNVVKDPTCVACVKEEGPCFPTP